jgi:hypothetical protein
MIKFFQKIRRRLLKEGRVTQYLKYAFGEIVLVVFGILIALSINSWNTNRLEDEKEKVYLKNLRRDLVQQVKLIENQMSYEISISNRAIPIIKQYKQTGGLVIDSSFTYHIGEILGRMTFIRQNPTFTDMLSSGNLDIISQLDLKNKIIQYYYDLERVEVILNKNNNLFVDEVFIPKTMELSEVQLHSWYTMKQFSNYFGQANLSEEQVNLDLNENSLKNISREQLKKPENELLFLNLINYRNRLGLIHYSMLLQLKDKTDELTKELGLLLEE